MSAPEKVMMPRYRCVHCRRSWANRATAVQHSQRCWFDPANRACKTCAHFQRGFNELEGGYVENDSCAVEVPLPTDEVLGHVRQTLAVHCSAHSLSRTYMNPDVLDVLDAADARAH